MQSFLNAGYTPQEVELASRKVNESEIRVQTSETQSSNGVHPSISSNKLPSNQPLKGKKSYRGLIIGLLAALGIIIVAFILLYFFQEQIF